MHQKETTTKPKVPLRINWGSGLVFLLGLIVFAFGYLLEPQRVLLVGIGFFLVQIGIVLNTAKEKNKNGL